jgi:hypothetical protein
MGSRTALDSSLKDTMRSFHRMLIALAALALPATLAAQKLAPGTWTGSIAPPDQSALEATFDVRMAGDTTKITLHIGPNQMDFGDVKVEPNRLLFSFSPGGTVVKCTLLLRDDKSFSGDCLDDQGGKGVIVMRPPKA